MQQQVEALPGVLAAAPTLHVAGMASTAAGRSAAFLGVAGDPVRERRMGFTVKLREGEPLADAPPREGEDRVLLAQGLAETLGVAAGGSDDPPRRRPRRDAQRARRDGRRG